MTSSANLERVIKAGKMVYLAIAVLVGGAHLLSAIDSKSAMARRCEGWQPTFISGLIAKPLLMGLTWPVSVFLPLARPYDDDCR